MGRNSRSPIMTIAWSASSRRIHGQSGVPKRSARSGHSSGKKCEWRSTTVTRPPAAAARPRPVAGRAARPGPGGPSRSSGRCGRPRRRRTRRTPAAGRRPGCELHLAAVDERRGSRGQYHSKPSTFPGRAGPLDHQADRAGHGPLRRVADVGGQEEDLALADGDVSGAAVLPHPQDHVAAQLVEELVAGVVVEVGALVGPADDGHDEVTVVPDLGVADRRLQLLAVLVDPAGEVDGDHVRPPPVLRAGRWP